MFLPKRRKPEKRPPVTAVKDIAGQIFGKWRVLERCDAPSTTREKGAFWLCECTCQTEYKAREKFPGARLRAGRFANGCKTCKTPYSHTATYQSWRGMRERCINPKHASFDRYGGRGITVCERWTHSFKNFIEDMGERPAGTSIDRINNNGNYEPNNCRWATTKQQSSNTSSFRLSDEQVDAVLRLLAGGAKQIDIAQALGVARGHIACIAVGISRKRRAND